MPDPKQDPNLRVEDFPASIRGKITELETALREYAFIGAAHPEDRAAIIESVQIARYDLERTIKTHLERANA